VTDETAEVDGAGELAEGVESADRSSGDSALDGSSGELIGVDGVVATGVDGLADDWDFSDKIASRAAPHTSAFMTIPGPPPKGVSSTV
jgi:hypothetical protein